MIQSVRGTKDILPDSIAKWHFVESIFRKVSAIYAYKELRTPIFEKTEVFCRSIGEQTDIVNKEMYTFNDKGGDSITLRPEMTAALVRSFIQNNLATANSVQKLWYYGPFFRYERPQKGRLRQFHQYGAECLGSPYPESDVEIIMLADSICKTLGIANYKLMLNSLGNAFSRERYKTALLHFLHKIKNELSDDSKIRAKTNPLRVLDSKDEKDIKLLENAPVLIDYFDEDSNDHFLHVQNLLKENQIPFEISSKLVRGLDYYSHTVFEFRNDYLGSQDAFGGGGRYDGLVEQLGGKHYPAIGFALGVERIIIILESLGMFAESIENTDVYIAPLGNEALPLASAAAQTLRQMELVTVTDLNRRSLKAQMREANKLNCRFSIIIGENEIKHRTFIIKRMSDGEQFEVTLNDLKQFDFTQ